MLMLKSMKTLLGKKSCVLYFRGRMSIMQVSNGPLTTPDES